MKRLKKFLVVSVMSITVFSMSMLSVPFQAGAAAKAGDLIKMNGLSSVYYLGADGKRYTFPNEKTFLSWYPDFSNVVTVPKSELESYSMVGAGNVTVRPGTKLVKITTDPTVYAVEPGGSLRSIVSEANATALWGKDWAKRVIDIPDGYFSNYKVGKPLTAGVYPVGSLVKASTGNDVYYYDGANYRKFADEAAFVSNRFDFGNVVTSSAAVVAAGVAVAANDSALTDASSGAGGIAGAGTGLTVALASNTGVSANVPVGSPVEMLKINLTASNDGDVSVSALTLSAAGSLGTATNIDSVTVYDGGVKVGTSKDINSDKVATFNFSTPIKVTAGKTKTLVVKATMAGVGNYHLGVVAATSMTAVGATVTGTFPIYGNTMSAVAGTSVGTMAMSAINTTDAPSTQFGADNVLLAEFNLTATNEPVIWGSARLKNAGTSGSLVGNMKIAVDGKDVKTGVELDNGYATFDMGSTVIAKGDTVQVQVYGDVAIGRVNDTIEMTVENPEDLLFTGKDEGYGITAAGTGSLDNSGEGILVTLTTGDFSIDIDKSGTTGTPAKEVKAGDNSVALATIKMTSNGENALVESISNTAAKDFYISGTGIEVGEISNLRLVDTSSAAASTYDVTATLTGTAPNAYLALSITDDISLVKGKTKTFVLKADLAGPTSATPIDTNDTLQVTMKSSAMTIKGETSKASITNVTPSSVAGATATVKAASLTWTTQTLTNKTFTTGAKDTLYQASLSAGAASDVTLNSVKISTVATGVDTFTDSNISSLELVFTPQGGTAKTKSLAGQIVEGIVGTNGYINFSTLTGFTVPAGKTAKVELKATFAPSFATTAGTWSLGIGHATDSIIARDADNNLVVESVVSVGSASRATTLASVGTLKAELRITDSDADNDTYLLAGIGTTAKRYIGELVFTTANEPVKIKTLVLGQVGTATDSDIKAVKLYNKAGVEVASIVPSANGHANFKETDLDSTKFTLSADQATSYFVGVVARSINADGDNEGTATFGRNVKFDLASSSTLTTLGLAVDTAVTADGANTQLPITIVEDANGTLVVGEYSINTVQSKTATITGAVLTDVANDMVNGTLTGGTETIGKYKLVFDNGGNRTSANEELKAMLKELKLTVATSSGVTVANVQAYIYGSSSNKTTVIQPVAGVATIDLTTLSGTTELVDGTVTLVVVADTTVGTGNQFVQTKINNLTTDFTYNGNAGTGSDFANMRLDISDVLGGKLSSN